MVTIVGDDLLSSRVGASTASPEGDCKDNAIEVIISNINRIIWE